MRAKSFIFTLVAFSNTMTLRVLLTASGGLHRSYYRTASAAAANGSPLLWERRRVPLFDSESSQSRGINYWNGVSLTNSKKWQWVRRNSGSQEDPESDRNHANRTATEEVPKNQAKGATDGEEAKTKIPSDISKREVELSPAYLATWTDVSKWLNISLRKQAAGVLAAMGLISSTATALMADKMALSDRFKPARALQHFLRSEGIDLELAPSLNRRILTNMMLLQRIQATILAEETGSSKTIGNEHNRRSSAAVRRKSPIPSWEEARRYMRCATAAYGNFMMQAAEVDARGRIDGKLQSITKEAISNHTKIPAKDIIIVDVDYDGDASHLRHFVAVDHANAKVVLSIRGTFSLSEMVVDVAGFSREFCGGEGHSEMATMAERVWETAGPTVADLLMQNEGYELIITGHSLGAGAACLLNILLSQSRVNRPKALDKTIEIVQRRPIRCFAFASPPVFSPLEVVPRAVESTVNYINQDDFVPFVSLNSVRHFFSCIRVLDEFYASSKHASKSACGGNFDRLRVIWGSQKPPRELVDLVRVASNEALVPKRGAPRLVIPARASVWMRHDSDGNYSVDICDSRRLALLGIHLDNNMLADHSPARYEHAFEALYKIEKEQQR